MTYDLWSRTSTVRRWWVWRGNPFPRCRCSWDCSSSPPCATTDLWALPLSPPRPKTWRPMGWAPTTTRGCCPVGPTARCCHWSLHFDQQRGSFSPTRHHYTFPTHTRTNTTVLNVKGCWKHYAKASIELNMKCLLLYLVQFNLTRYLFNKYLYKLVTVLLI